MAYTMIAEREHHKIRKQRESALIVLANAQVMEAEGWKVVITDEDGNSQPLAEFEASISQKFASWYKPKCQPPLPTTVLVPNVFALPQAGDSDAEAIVAAELAAEEVETATAEVDQVPEIAEDDFETADDANAAPVEAAEHKDSTVEAEAELAS